jgi:hypothetical protein
MQMQLAIVEGVNEWNHFIDKAKKDVIKQV